MNIGFMATYPARALQCKIALDSVAAQLDKIVLVANEYGDAGTLEGVLRNVEVVIPKYDLKDTGKFIGRPDPQDVVFYLDDDIMYPENYVEVMRDGLTAHSDHCAVVGVHGTIYSDFYDGAPGSRLVYSFRKALGAPSYVNQLGTGTVACFGHQVPCMEFMAGSERFVDVRFALHCHQSRYPRICLPREDGWLREIATETSIYNDFTLHWPLKVLAEVQEVAGFRHLPSLYA